MYHTVIQESRKVDFTYADINDDARKGYKIKWSKMMENLGTYMALMIYRGRKLPKTFSKGKMTLDIIAVSEKISNNMINKTIEQCTYIWKQNIYLTM